VAEISNILKPEEPGPTFDGMNRSKYPVDDFRICVVPILFQHEKVWLDNLEVFFRLVVKTREQFWIVKHQHSRFWIRFGTAA
jgi:hypothetical protein